MRKEEGLLRNNSGLEFAAEDNNRRVAQHQDLILTATPPKPVQVGKYSFERQRQQSLPSQKVPRSLYMYLTYPCVTTRPYLHVLTSLGGPCKPTQNACKCFPNPRLSKPESPLRCSPTDSRLSSSIIAAGKIFKVGTRWPS